MRSRRGYLRDKMLERFSKEHGFTSAGKFLLRYFAKRTCRNRWSHQRRRALGKEDSMLT